VLNTQAENTVWKGHASKAEGSPRLTAGLLGALWGLAASGLLTPRLDPGGRFEVLAGGAIAGLLGGLLFPHRASLLGRGECALGAVLGLVMWRFPEPTFFLLVAVLAAAATRPLEVEAPVSNPGAHPPPR
jgi:hypothetical protein